MVVVCLIFKAMANYYQTWLCYIPSLPVGLRWFSVLHPLRLLVIHISHRSSTYYCVIVSILIDLDFSSPHTFLQGLAFHLCMGFCAEMDRRLGANCSAFFIFVKCIVYIFQIWIHFRYTVSTYFLLACSLFSFIHLSVFSKGEPFTFSLVWWCENFYFFKWSKHREKIRLEWKWHHPLGTSTVCFLFPGFLRCNGFCCLRLYHSFLTTMDCSFLCHKPKQILLSLSFCCCCC